MKKQACDLFNTKILNPYFIIINIININVFVKIRKPISFCKNDGFNVDDAMKQVQALNSAQLKAQTK